MELFTTFLFSMPDIICRKIPSGTILVMHNMVGFKIYGDLSLKRYQRYVITINLTSKKNRYIFVIFWSFISFYHVIIIFGKTFFPILPSPLLDARDRATSTNLLKKIKPPSSLVI